MVALLSGQEARSAASAWVKNHAFEALQALDDWLHTRGFKPGIVCRLVGRWEIAYYERGIDWDTPIYVRDMPEKTDA